MPYKDIEKYFYKAFYYYEKFMELKKESVCPFLMD